MIHTNLCPELHYRRTSQGLILTACYGIDGCIWLPDEIDGEPITAIAPYAFSKDPTGGLVDQELVWLSEDADLLSDRHRLAAEEVLEVHLPRYVRDIGKYAFYRCRNLRKLTFHGALPSIGGGALTGCRFREVEIYLQEGEQSALKSILDEIRFAVHVRIHYQGAGKSEAIEHMEDSRETVAELLFPEHYEEAVENTPARILYTSHHGAGGYYRQCFYNRELDYKKYDGLLPWAIAEEEEETVVCLSLLRLCYPYRLSESAKEAYEDYVRGHVEVAARRLIAEEDLEKLMFLLKYDYFTEETLEDAITCAGERKKTEILSVLMDEKFKRFPKKRKTFEL